MIHITEPTTEGPLAVRMFIADLACQAYVGHRHDYDHPMLVTRGSLCVEQDGVWHEKRYFAGDWIIIAKNSFHTIKPMENDTRWSCVYFRRDMDGIVVDHYVGNVRESQAIAEKHMVGA